MKMRFLLDEHLPLHMKAAIHHRNPLIDVLRVGDPGAPPLATPDPDILNYLGKAQRALITKNRRSMMEHYGEAIAAEQSHWGIFVVASHLSIRNLAEEVEMLWEASEAEEWIDQLQSLPF
jgi:hypothetical protein